MRDILMTKIMRPLNTGSSYVFCQSLNCRVWINFFLNVLFEYRYRVGTMKSMYDGWLALGFAAEHVYIKYWSDGSREPRQMCICSPMSPRSLSVALLLDLLWSTKDKRKTSEPLCKYKFMYNVMYTTSCFRLHLYEIFKLLKLITY